MNEAHEIIKELAERDPIIWINRDEEKACYFCLAELWYPNDKHEKDCLWARAVAFVENIKEMRVKIKSVGHGRCKLISIDYCCDDMRESDAVKFGDEYNSSRRVNVFDCSPYPEGAVYNDEPINFCPFCGANIVIDEELPFDKTANDD